MMIESRDGARRLFLTVWRRLRDGETPAGIEELIAQVLRQHPEYHALLDEGEKVLTQDFGHDAPVHNPFLHMGLHVALLEQIGADRPPGIRQLHAALATHHPDLHAIEHRIIGCLAEELWRAQAEQRLPDDAAYLAAVRRLL